MIHTINDLDIFYQTIGEGRPIIFLHGYWAEGEQMMGYMEPIMSQREGWKRFYIDLPGMGRTPGPDWIETSDQMLDILCQFIDAILPTGTYALGGYSYGAYMSQGIVARQPQRVDGLFTVCSVIYGDVKQRTMPPNSPPWDEEINPPDDKNKLPFLERLRYFGYPYTFDLWHHAETFDKPTLIIAGRHDDAVGYHDQYGTIERYPRGTYAVLDQAGHGLPADQPRVFNALVHEWLDRVENPGSSWV